MTISVRLLGSFEVTSAREVILDSAWRPLKAAALVKILALEPGRTLHREQLIDRLWPEADAAAGSSSFYKNVHHLRTASRAVGLPDLILLNRGAVTLEPQIETDIDAFRELARIAFDTRETSAYERALDACGGELLPGDLYEPWTEPHRDELRALQHRLRLEVAERYLQRRRFDDAVHQYQQVLAGNALSEETHRGLMRAYSTSGQRELALRQYDICKDRLHAELGAVPSQETEQLIAEIRRVDRLTSEIDAAIGAPMRAGEAALQRYAWPEAIERFREAIDRLHAVGEDDEREAELWLKLAQASSANQGTLDVADYVRRGVQLARRTGAIELEARALVQFQDGTDAIPNNHAGHRESMELINDALDRVPSGPSAARAMLLAASARPLAAAERPGDERHVTGRLSVAGGQAADVERRLREAVAIAHAVGRRDVIAFTLSRLRVYITSPDTLAERLELTRELIGSGENKRHPVREFTTCLLRHEDLLESGDLDGARIQAREMRRLGDAMHSSGVLAVAGSLLATHETADGNFPEAKRVLYQSRGLDAQHGDNANSQFRFGIQLLMLRWHEGRIDEMYDNYRRTVDLLPRVKGIRAVFALICAESGRVDEAGAELERLAADGLDQIPRDYMWWLAMVSLTRVAVATNACVPAADLYRLIEPYADRNASIAGAVSFGSASLYLAQLAALLGEREAAERHYQNALAFNIRTRQRTWVARTRYHFAEFLSVQRDAARAGEMSRIARSDAQEIGMPIGQ